MAPARRSVDEIVQSVLGRGALLNPRMRGMLAVLVGGAFAVALLVVADFYKVPSPISLEPLGVAGAPYRALLALAVAVEGLLVADRLMKHEEPPYTTLAQAAAVTLAAVGAILLGVGAVVFLLWTSGLQGHFEGMWQVTESYYLLLLVGSSLVLAGLAAIGPSLIRPLVRAE
jgi:hypothetical protein